MAGEDYFISRKTRSGSPRAGGWRPAAPGFDRSRGSTGLPVLISVPHGGTWVPGPAKKYCRLGRADLLRDGDTWSRELYALQGGVTCYQDTPVARAILDLNRGPGDLPPGNPDGVVKSMTVQGVQVWQDPGGPPEETLRLLLQDWYWPYHRALEEKARGGPGGGNKIILALDCHTMLPQGPPRSPDQGKPRPLVCLSNRGDHRGEPRGKGPVTAPPEMLRAFQEILQEGLAGSRASLMAPPYLPGTPGEMVTLNQPFQGGYITRHHGRGGHLPWIQVEINRGLYLPEDPAYQASPTAGTLRQLKKLQALFYQGLKSLLKMY